MSSENSMEVANVTVVTKGKAALVEVPLGDGAPPAVPEGNRDLQAAFKDYQKKRLEVRREARRREAAAAEIRRTPEAMQALRERFVQKVEEYIGTPYAASYHQEEGSEHHNAPLYLDCCALVRRCVRDLADDFGFVLGRGNQAYQFDTLPERKDSIEDLKPGDLVFYQSTFVEGAGMKPQKHDMVHVEVFVGGETGEETIGSLPHTCWRTNNGEGGVCGVQRFPSYKCEATRKWKLDKYWFCSIDTWLKGQCQSCCTEHDWKEAMLTEKGCGRSLFDLAAADNDDCVGAED